MEDNSYGVCARDRRYRVFAVVMQLTSLRSKFKSHAIQNKQQYL